MDELCNIGNICIERRSLDFSLTNSGSFAVYSVSLPFVIHLPAVHFALTLLVCVYARAELHFYVQICKRGITV